jgi:hypothetical protein
MSLIYNNAENTKLYVKALYSKNIGGFGFGHISVGEGWMFMNSLGPDDQEELLNTGMLFIVETGFEAVKTTGEIIVERIVQNLVRIGQAIVYDTAAQGNTNSEPARLVGIMVAKFYTADRHLIPAFSVLNS